MHIACEIRRRRLECRVKSDMHDGEDVPLDHLQLLDESMIGIAESVDGLIGLSSVNEGRGSFGR